MRLILVRHAETDGNRHRYIGREDLPLNAVGHLQSLRLAETLQSEPIGAIFCSPLCRAVETVRPLAEDRALSIDIRDDLVEIDFGDLQGEIKGERSFKLRKDYLVKAMPGGESLQDVWQRLDDVVSEIQSVLEHQQTVLVCGHYWSNRVLLAKLGGVRLHEALRSGKYKPTNASALALDFDATAAHESESSWLSV